jgi:hypothetical protein
MLRCKISPRSNGEGEEKLRYFLKNKKVPFIINGTNDFLVFGPETEEVVKFVTGDTEFYHPELKEIGEWGIDLVSIHSDEDLRCEWCGRSIALSYGSEMAAEVTPAEKNPFLQEVAKNITLLFCSDCLTEKF